MLSPFSNSKFFFFVSYQFSSECDDLKQKITDLKIFTEEQFKKT